MKVEYVITLAILVVCSFSQAFSAWTKSSDMYQGRGQSISIFRDSSGTNSYYFVADSSSRLWRTGSLTSDWLEIADIDSRNPRCVLMIPGSNKGFIGRYGYGLDYDDDAGIYWTFNGGSDWAKRDVVNYSHDQSILGYFKLEVIADHS